MRNKGGQEDGKCSVFSSHCSDQHSFDSEIGRNFENIRFFFHFTPDN
jgi:hypothetical protein